MTSVSKNVYMDKLADIVNKYKNRYHSDIKIKSVDAKSNKHIDFNKENNEQDPKYEVGGNAGISKHTNIFARLLSKMV